VRNRVSRLVVVGVALTVAGAGVLARNRRELRRLVGRTLGRNAVDVHTAIRVAAPLHEVFDFWAHWDNWPRVMSHVREVRETAIDRHHWVVAGAAGVPFEWDTCLTKFGSNQVIAWETLPTAALRHSGSIQVRPNSDGSTQLDVRMSYRPPAGAKGGAVATLLGSDLETSMNEDLARFKALLEHGGVL
jgi:uncharacterized membrane protein